MRFYKIGFNVNNLKFEADIIELQSLRDTVYEDLAAHLSCEGLEFQDYSEEIVMIVDENAFYKDNYPIFQLQTNYRDIVELAGTIIFARNIETEYSTDIGSITNDDVLDLRNNLVIKLIGLTKN